MVLTLQFTDTSGKQKFELKLAPDTTFEQLVKLVGEKTAAKGSVNLKNGDSLLVAANNDKLSKLSITNGAKLQFEIIPEVAPATPSKTAPAPKKVPSDDWNEGDYAESKNDDWGKFVADSVDDVFEIIEEDPQPQSQGGAVSDVAIIAPPPSLVRQRSYKVMGKIQITQKQKDMVDDVSTVLNLGPGKSTVLLRHYKWNQEKLLKEYTTNPIKVLESAGVERGPDDVEPEVLDEPKDAKKDGKEEPKEYDCPFCGSSVGFGNTYSMECGHRFCLDCWKNWFTAEFEKGAECIFTKCPEYKCKELVPTEIFQKYISKEQREKVEDWLNTSFVRLNNYIKWCPRQGCDKAVEYSKQGMKTVTCDCGYKFCFGCGNEAHDPAPCKAVLEWLKKDNSLLLWMREQQKVKDLVKACTNCHELIEKNQGCKHMTCRNCKHEFCWLCYQNWHGHNESLCNDYEGKDRAQNEKEAKGDSSAAGLRRYQFYYTRFENHQKAIKFAERMVAETEKKMNKMQDMGGASLNQVHWLLDAVTTVIDCRRLLQWSYVWGYLMEEDSTLKAHFKMHQDMLEEFTEELSAMTEQPLAKLVTDKARTSVINHTRVIQKFRQNIIDFAKANH